MRSLRHPGAVVVIVLGTMLLSSSARAQTVQKQGTGVVTGRVTSDDKGIANVSVQLFSQDRFNNRSAISSARTDDQGNYRLTNVPAGRYTVSAVAPTMVGQSDNPYGDFGKLVTLAEGETVEKLDFALVRGGVITGRITDAEGSPVIGQRVQINRTDKPGMWRSSVFNPFMLQTDDRGIYRIYGVPPGGYTVGVGESREDGSVTFGAGARGYFPLTYYPGVTDKSKATVLEVKEGSEDSNIDIMLGRREKTYVATGRVVDENGQPLSNLAVGYGALMKNDQMGGFGGGMPSDDQGRFRLEGLLPGRYVATIWTNGISRSNGGYSNQTRFEILDSDISGLEIKVRQGASLSGVAVVEGSTDRAVLSKLNQLWITANPVQDRSQMSWLNTTTAQVAPDGTFTITGLRPGKIGLSLSSFPPVPGFRLARVEHDGAAQPEFDITQGAQVTGVRVVIQYGSGSIRGLIKTDGDALPDVRRMSLDVHPLAEGAGGAQPQTAMVDSQGRLAIDSRGRFLIEGLPTGEYEVVVRFFPSADGPQGARPLRPQQVKQRVSVTDGVESQVTLTINTSTTEPEGNNNE